MKYYIVVGEASGDLHGANLMKAIIKNDPNAEFRFWGGDKMKAVGGTIVRHYKDHDFMGLVEVIKHLRTILGNISFCASDIEQYNPDCVLFIDFPGFNLKVAKKIQHLNTTIFYYISPTIWAWKEKRANLVKRFTDRMFVILPFEKAFYKKRHNIDVDFFGHPLLDAIEAEKEKMDKETFISSNNLPNKKMIAVLPGSRESEVRENLKTMQEIADDFADYQFVIAGMSRFSIDYYQKHISKKNVSVVLDQTYELVRKSEAAIVVSGTATLETALLGTPEIIVFKTHQLTWTIGNWFVDLNYLGLPNLIMGNGIVPELLQRDMTSSNIKSRLNNILNNYHYRQQMLDDYDELKNKLGGIGCSDRLGAEIVNNLNKNDKSKYYRHRG